MKTILIFASLMWSLPAVGQYSLEDPDSLINLSEYLYNQGHYDSSTHYLQIALTLFKNSNNIDKQIRCMNRLGRNTAYLGNMEEGHRLLDESIKMNEGRANELLAEAYHYKGIVNYFEGNYEPAIQFTQQGYDLRVKIFGPDHENVTKSLNNLGILYEVTGELDKAFNTYQETMSILLNLYGADHVEVANMFNNFGTNAYMRGRYREALDFYQLSLDMYKTLQGESAETANCYLNIGSVFLELAEFAKAREYTKRAENIYLNLYGENYFNLYTVYQNNGILFKGLEEYDKAIKYTKKAMDFVVAYYGEDHPLLGEFYLNLGVIYDDKKEYDLSLDQYRTALKIYEASEGTESLSAARVYNNIGTTYTHQEKYDSAKYYIQWALKIKKANLPERHVSITATLHNLGYIYYYEKDFEESLKYFQQALMTNHVNYSDSAITAIPPTDGFFNLDYFFDGLLSKALSFFEYANQEDIKYLDYSIQHLYAIIELLEKHVMQFSNKEDMILFGRETTRMVDVAQRVYYEKYELTRDIRYVDTAFYFMERSKSAALLASLAEAEAKSFSGVPDSLIAFEDSLQFITTTLKQELSMYYEGGAGDDHPAVIQLSDSLFQIRRLYDNFVTKLNADYPDFYNLRYDVNIVTTDQLIEGYLKKNKRTALIEYFIGEEELFVCVITPKKKTIIRKPIDENFEKTIRAFRNTIIYNVQDQIPVYAQKTYQLVMKEVDDYFDKEKLKIRNIMVVTDGILGYIPFEAMAMETNTETENVSFSKQNYLVNKYNISYALSATVFYTQNSKPPLYSEKEYVAYAPVFTDGTKTNYLVNTSERDVIGPLYTRSFTRNNIITPIPATKDEVESIYGLYTDKNLFAEYFLFQDANETAIKAKELGEFKYVHFATHGFVNDQYPELSGLVLSQDTTSAEDGILFTGEIYGLNINAELVTLSACETGLGKLVKGEGIMGLTRAFMYAGARNVMVSLWKVADKSTSDLMIEFYNQLLEGNSKPKSLAMAKRKLVKEEKYSNPYYWAPFVLIGF